ncbi:hypothetical protein [Streptomyces fumanus]|uniref:hypothetical protein n=1 Tax=Streptomyces fumanus TaxID=67302 RepID=UPI00340C1C8D
MDARRARSRHEAELMGLPRVTGVGTGRDEQTGEEVVVVFVTRDTPHDRLAEPDLVPEERDLVPEEPDLIPEELDGVPVRVVVIGESEPRE